MNRRLITAVVTAAAVAGLASPGFAKHKPPIEKSYDVTAPAPDPTNYLSAGGVQSYSVCAQTVPNSYHHETFKAPEAGTLKIELSDYQGDWDLLLMNSKKAEMGFAGSSDLGVPEKLTFKIKKADSFIIVACNWAGGPTGKVKYTFTYLK